MKAMVVSPIGGRVPPTRGIINSNLGINGTRRDLEAEEVAAYLTKLRSLVPDMPRKRKLSKLEVIQRVIEYICDLQTTLEETNIHNSDSGNNNNNNNNNIRMSTTTTTTSSSANSQINKSTIRQPLQPLLNSATSSVSAIAAIER
ncbi:DNA-binding protein inhibitor ID-3 [Microplitis demolitor]|uniref:DNA-binding protein inhibitor ID-3 n=1 Tax=Microplitis demolitor TaxID=69319 RepID=UPI0004CCA746|nr:DNA-binding protein inhibitor ID-3 [Microplitis demolitor]